MRSINYNLLHDGTSFHRLNTQSSQLMNIGINISIDKSIKFGKSDLININCIDRQDDLSDLVTVLLKLNCFLSTTVAKQCTFFYNPAFIISSSVS